jgi:DnaJ-class molecular chaperone
MNQKQVPIKTTCNACGGEGVLDTGKIFTLAGRDHPLLNRCQACDGKGTLLTWVDVHQFAQMLHAIAVEEQSQ